MILPASERPKNFRTLVLAIPFKHQRREIYRPKKFVREKYDSVVKPAAIRGEAPNNWRINQLALPPPFKILQKYVYVPEPGCGSGVIPSALTGKTRDRTIDISKPNLWYLKKSRAICKEKGLDQLVENIDNSIEQTWNTVYMYYRKQMEDKRRKKEARLRRLNQDVGKSKAELRAERKAKIDKWVAVKALPKPVFKPEPVSRGPVGKPNAIHLAQMAEPTLINPKFIRPSIDSVYIDPYAVKASAKQYIASERVIELSKNPSYRLIKQKISIPGAVRKSALKGKVPPHCDILATPRKKAAEKETDIKENPFQVSPLALRGRFPKRVLELCKPIER